MQNDSILIKSKVVNEEASVKLIRHLKEEVTRLKSILANVKYFDHVAGRL